LGHSTRFQVSSDGRLLAHEDPLGRVHTVHWTEAGTVRSVDSASGRLVIERDEAQRLAAVQRAGGSGVRVGWGEDGLVARLEDGAGATLSFGRDPQGRLEVIQTRAGGRWSLERDSAGRVQGVVAPTGERWRVERDPLGRVRTLLSAGGERTAWQRDAGGRVSRVKTHDGRVTGISRDAAGRIRELRPSGSLPVTLHRGPAGEISAVRTGTVQVRIARDAGGRPVGAGPIAWAHDGDGRVSAVRSPVASLRLDRSPTGALTGVSTPDGSWQLAVERDARDLPVAWRGTDGAVQVERDADGRIRVERGPAGELLVGRDGRGLVDRIESGRGLWRWMRDASGAVLRVIGPDGPAVGVVRDATGRSVLERLPGGHMLLRAYRPGGTETEVHDSADQTLLAHALGQDVFGNAHWTEVLGEPRQAWTLDGLARLVSRVGTDERAWSFGPGMDQGPDGQVLLRDRVGRLQEASLEAELPVFGVGRRSVALHRDASGRIEAVAGDEGQARVHHDVLGRLVGVEIGGAEWRVRWDARGRPGLVTWPGGEGQGLLWAPAPVEGDLQPALAVGPGLVRALLPSPRGPLGWSTSDGGVGALARLPVDGPVLELTGGEVVEQRTLPRGAGTTAGSLAFTGHDRVQLFGGGPSVSGDGRCLDPLLGQSTSGLLPWPWAHDRSSERALLDPAAWAPEGSWHDPVALLVSLGELRLPRLPEALPTVADPEPAVAWLPASLDRSPAAVELPELVVGRIGGATEDEERLLRLLVAHLLTDAGPLPAAILPGALLDLPSFVDLPPELAIIGAPRWEERSLDPWTGRFSLARWGPPPY
jgi:YD repeat-containing protein